MVPRLVTPARLEVKLVWPNIFAQNVVFGSKFNIQKKLQFLVFCMKKKKNRKSTDIDSSQIFISIVILGSKICP